MGSQVITLDMREDIRAGREPFSKIMAAVARLTEDQSLRLIAPFEPKPLYAVLANQGFCHESKAVADGSWEVLFGRDINSATTSSVTATAAPSGSRPAPSAEILEVDARGLEPPQPLVTILDAVEQLSEGAAIRARTDRRPMHLYPVLEERGFTAATEQSPDGSFVTDIRRR
jgi:uncharacterized protein (DUF2249 family)